MDLFDLMIWHSICSYIFDQLSKRNFERQRIFLKMGLEHLHERTNYLIKSNWALEKWGVTAFEIAILISEFQ